MSSGDESNILTFENSLKKFSDSFSNEDFRFPYLVSSSNEFRYLNLLFISEICQLVLCEFPILKFYKIKTFKIKVLMLQGPIQDHWYLE